MPIRRTLQDSSESVESNLFGLRKTVVQRVTAVKFGVDSKGRDGTD